MPWNESVDGMKDDVDENEDSNDWNDCCCACAPPDDKATPEWCTNTAGWIGDSSKKKGYSLATDD